MKAKLNDLTFVLQLGQYYIYEKQKNKTSGNSRSPKKSKSPASERTIENRSEFAGCSMIGKALRLGLAEIIKPIADRRLSARLTVLFKKVCEKGKGVRGKRSFEILKNNEILEGFEFSGITLNSVFAAPFDIEANPKRNKVTISIPQFNTHGYMNPPGGATHFRIINAITVLSDYTFNNAMKIYKPLNPEVNILNEINYSPYTPLKGTTPDVLTITSTLAASPILTSTSGLIACIGIDFFQQINGKFYKLNTKNAMRLEKVF